MNKNLKAIIVTLSIILVCGGLLAILSNLLFVSEEERIQRAIDSIYTEEVTLDETVNVEEYDEFKEENKETGVIKSCYKLSNGDYLILSTGKKGYSNGTVTVYVALNDKCEVKKVVQDSYTGQTLMSKLSSLYKEFIGKDKNDSKEDVKEIVSGATYSSTATSNAVYLAIQFAGVVIGG